MSFQRRLAIATRGYRGTFGINNYITEEFTIDQGEVGVDIQELLEVASVETLNIDTVVQVVGVEVRSVEQLAGDYVINVEIEEQTVSINLEDSCL